MWARKMLIKRIHLSDRLTMNEPATRATFDRIAGKVADGVWESLSEKRRAAA